MQVKRRINQFFGNILRKEKTLQDGEDEMPSSRPKKKSNKKSNQSYSQWDLMEHIDTGSNAPCHKDSTIYSDGLALDILEVRDEEMENNFAISEIQFENENNKRRSFLKRSGSFFRRSKRKQEKKEAPCQNQLEFSVESESLTNIVREINETLIAVATFGTENGGNNSSPEPFASEPVTFERTTWDMKSTPGCSNERDAWQNEQSFNEHSSEIKKDGIKGGLRRQASKLASKFQRKSGSMRLKTAVSNENLPKTNLSRHRSASWSASNGMIDKRIKDDDENPHKRTQSFRRKMSFKKTKKAVVKGVSSLGKSMVHASAVMPVAYECPPASFYPDYDLNSPTELEHYYYRTISYQERDNSMIDPNGRHGQSTRPTTYYQHGYCN